MAAPDLTTVANLKAWLGIPASNVTEDTLLARLVTAESTWIQNWFNRTIWSQVWTETRDGNGNTRMALANKPVTAFTSVAIDGQVIPASTGFGVPGYTFSDSSLYLTGYRFTRGEANVSLAYTAGLTSVPMELEQACLELCAYRYRERDRIGHASKNIQGETVAFVTKDIPDSVRTILNQFRDVVPL